MLINIFDTRIIKTLFDFKKFGVLQPFNFFFIILISSIAGVPPLVGFTIKFISFLLLISANSVFYIIILVIFNCFTLYFYIQNLRYIINDGKNNYFIYVNNHVYLSNTSLFILFFMLSINIFGFFYMVEFLPFFQLFVI